MGCGSTDTFDSPIDQPTDSVPAPKPTVQDGPQVIHTEDGGRMEGVMVAGKRTGPWLSYFANGGIRSRANYIDGLEEGPTEVFHPTGVAYYTGQYTEGKPSGEWVFFDSKSKELKRVVYDSTGTVIRP